MYLHLLPLTIVSDEELEFFDSIIRILQLVLDVGCVPDIE